MCSAVPRGVICRNGAAHSPTLGTWIQTKATQQCSTAHTGAAQTQELMGTTASLRVFGFPQEISIAFGCQGMVKRKQERVQLPKKEATKSEELFRTIATEGPNHSCIISSCAVCTCLRMAEGTALRSGKLHRQRQHEALGSLRCIFRSVIEQLPSQCAHGVCCSCAGCSWGSLSHKGMRAADPHHLA